ncbi:MAG: glycosyltransferase family 2 protein [Candidatus Delongbacteria bacterium]|jgi:glycosyltransferase involved in cell wall biosynthesis|nr:glycosyltransferase family 2 protein [Candidatus Delongbacteria bacterium]
MKTFKVDLSIIIPVFNDEEVLEELYDRLMNIIPSRYDDYEIIMVDDGSKDNSFEKLKLFHQKNNRIKILKQSRNFGQANSILAGLQYSKGEIVVIMDSDLQDRPEDIPVLIKALQEKNVAMSIAKWESREDSLRKKMASWLFYQFSQRITDIKYEKGLGVFRAIKRAAIKELINVPEITGTVLSLLYWSGISRVSVPLKRDKRFAGATGYTLKKMFKLSMERIFSYSLFPMRLMTNTGLIIGFVSIVVGLFFIIRKFFNTEVLPGWTSLIVIVSFLFGVNFIFMGLLGEYIGRIYLETKKRPKYVTEIILDSSKED